MKIDHVVVTCIVQNIKYLKKISVNVQRQHTLPPTTPYPRLFSTEATSRQRIKVVAVVGARPSPSRLHLAATMERSLHSGPAYSPWDLTAEGTAECSTAVLDGNERGPAADDGIDCNDAVRQRSMCNANTPCPQRHLTPDCSRRSDVSTAHQSGCRRGGAGPRRRACTWRRPWSAPALRITPGISQRKGRRSARRQ